MALSTIAVEYIVASDVICEAMWLRKLLAGLFNIDLDPTLIYYDNQSCLKISDNPVSHKKENHIEIKYHFIRDMLQRGAMELWYISIDE